jgi:hypothetical protein
LVLITPTQEFYSCYYYYYYYYYYKEMDGKITPTLSRRTCQRPPSSSSIGEIIHRRSVHSKYTTKTNSLSALQK